MSQILSMEYVTRNSWERNYANKQVLFPICAPINFDSEFCSHPFLRIQSLSRTRPQRDWLLLGWSQVWSCCLENREINLQTRRCNISTLTIRFPKQLLTQHDKRPGYCSVIKSAIVNCKSNFLSDEMLSVVVVVKIYILLPSPCPWKPPNFTSIVKSAIVNC